MDKITAEYVLELLVASGNVTQEKVNDARAIATTALGHDAALASAPDVARQPDAPKPVLWYAFKHNHGNGKVGWTFHAPAEYATAYRDTCLEIVPLSAAPVQGAPAQQDAPSEARAIAEDRELPLPVARIAHIGKDHPWEISLVWHVAVPDLAARGIVVDALLYAEPPAAPVQGAPAQQDAPDAVDADARDAARYRWLRSDPPVELAVRRHPGETPRGCYLDGPELDAAIDAAMKAPQ